MSDTDRPTGRPEFEIPTARDCEWVECPCVKAGLTYSNIGPDLDGSPDRCPLCDDRGEIPDYIACEDTDADADADADAET